MKDSGWKMMAVAGFAAMGGMMWSQVLAPRDAVGYPSGAAVSYGANPLFAVGSTAGSGIIVVAPAGQIAVVTDVVLAAAGGACLHTVSLETSGGETLAAFKLASDTSTGSGYDGFTPTVVQHAFSSGLPVPAGETLNLTESGTCSFGYTISGYYAEP